MYLQNNAAMMKWNRLHCYSAGHWWFRRIR